MTTSLVAGLKRYALVSVGTSTRPSQWGDEASEVKLVGKVPAVHEPSLGGALLPLVELNVSFDVAIQAVSGDEKRWVLLPSTGGYLKVPSDEGGGGCACARSYQSIGQALNR